MSELAKLLGEIDRSVYDIRDQEVINTKFQDLIGKLLERGDEDAAYEANIIREAFAFGKSFEIETGDNNKATTKGNGIKPKIKGTQKLQDGSEVPFEWPDIKNYTKREYDIVKDTYYIFNNNLFPKTELGLILYFAEVEKSNQFKAELAKFLFELSKTYLLKAKLNAENSVYVMYFFQAIKGAFLITTRNKILNLADEIIKYLEHEYVGWDLTNHGSLRIIIDILNLFNNEYIFVKDKVLFKDLLAKNKEAADVLKSTNSWGAIAIADISFKIEQKLNTQNYPWRKLTAEYYEEMADISFHQNRMSSVSFIETALRIYREIDDADGFKRTENRYNDIRGKFKLNEIHEQLSDEQSKQIVEKIKQEVEVNDASGIIKTLVTLPMFASLNEIEQAREAMVKQSPLLAMFASSVLDKRGNTIDTFYTKEEIEKHAFWEVYSLRLQIGQQALSLFFWEALKKGKLSYDSMMEYLRASWMNQKVQRIYYGNPQSLIPLEVLEPVISNSFFLFNALINGDDVRKMHLLIIDSLVLKCEYLLRIFSELVGIKTFKPRSKGNQKLVMERNIDELFSELNKNNILQEEDIVLMKYILTEKVGHNLRNRVAHGLMDYNEYHVEEIFIVLCLILKLANYKISQSV